MHLPGERLDEVAAVLWEQGTEGFEEREAPGGGLVLLASFPSSEGLEERLRQALAGLGPLQLRPARFPDVDWVARFREHVRRFQAAGFTVAPPWDLPEDLAHPDLLVLEPGQAFGTGSHETTRLCLAALRADPPAGAAVLDLGCGTGLLALAASRLGARLAVAVDLDELCTSAARRHAAVNRVELRVVQGDLARALAPARFDVVLANLTAPLLVARAGEIAAQRAPGGRLVLAGLLGSDLEEVRSAYPAELATRVRLDGDWACLELRPAP